MSNVTICARFRPLSSKEMRDSVCVRGIDAESFVFQVEIYMEKVRDLLDLSKGNIQIKESKTQGIFLSGVTEVPVSDSTEALQYLCVR